MYAVYYLRLLFSPPSTESVCYARFLSTCANRTGKSAAAIQRFCKHSRKETYIEKIACAILLSVIFAITAYLSGKRVFISAFTHVFIIFTSINIYDLLILDWGIFCHSKKIRIKGTEDMDKAYTDYSFHLRGAIKRELPETVISLLSGGIVSLITALF